jgi:outer membrane lipoprotein SlyB
METTRTSANPLYAIAAIAVILFSGVGVAAMLGWIPTSQSKLAEPAVSVPAAPPLAVVAAPETAPRAPEPSDRQTSDAAARPHHHHAANRPVDDGRSAPAAGMPPPGVNVAQAGTNPQAGTSTPAAPSCPSCGLVRSVQQVETRGEGSGVGAVAGGVLGAVVGHQVGQGSGNTLATILGAGGGALAGNAVEKNVKKSISWKVTVDLNDGSTRTFSFANAPAYSSGDHVRVANGQLVSN